MLKFPFKKRLKQLRSRLKEEGGSTALLISSAPHKTRNRDSSFSYRQESDFFYLTGITEPGYTLLVSTEHDEPLLFTAPVDPVRVVWDGASQPARSLASAISAELIVSKNIHSEINAKLRGTEHLFFQNTASSLAWEVASKLMALPSYQRSNAPAQFSHLDCIIGEMRLFKDKAEVDAIKHSARITNSALFGAFSLIQPGTSEREIAGAIDFFFRSHGAVPAFNSIVASGAAAATLHYEKLAGNLRKGDLLLLDVGAEYNCYAGDISRVIPVSGTFSPIQRDLYEIVLASQKAAIKKMRPGTSFAAVHKAAARVLTEGLVDLNVLKGKVSKLLKKNAYKKYFPHSIGHLLGLDVHDVGRSPQRGPLVLKKGMVLTVEPGLYFAKRAGNVPACGIRIEDDVLITGGAPEILSDGFPKECKAIEQLFG
ncbi:MAG: aminopeptidase P family protein [Proteobacteria bacterium]|nr:aminopeptidase P family protein [Pseudomonadota bacterium]